MCRELFRHLWSRGRRSEDVTTGNIEFVSQGGTITPPLPVVLDETTLNHRVADLNKIDEALMTYDLSDEALEAAARV